MVSSTSKVPLYMALCLSISCSSPGVPTAGRLSEGPRRVDGECAPVRSHQRSMVRGLVHVLLLPYRARGAPLRFRIHDPAPNFSPVLHFASFSNILFSEYWGLFKSSPVVWMQTEVASSYTPFVACSRFVTLSPALEPTGKTANDLVHGAVMFGALDCCLSNSPSSFEGAWMGVHGSRV